MYKSRRDAREAAERKRRYAEAIREQTDILKARFPEGLETVRKNRAANSPPHETRHVEELPTTREGVRKADTVVVRRMAQGGSWYAGQELERRGEK